MENLNYTYNIQSQLTGINANYARDRTAGHWWGTSLHYYDGFTQPKYDGTISGVVWRSRGKFDEANAYGFDYDVMSRLKQAYFTQTTAVNTNSGGWNQNKNFTTDNLNYDENGNILNMRSQSTAFGTTRTVDDLTYSYNTNSNRLTRVQDNGSGTPAGNQTPAIAGATGLKDFKDGTNTGDDYTYDANGNIITDANKNFTATYNHLDKPERIIFENNPNKDIRYVYDATGERLQKIVRHNDTVRTTTYVDGLTYLNDTTLLFFTHDGGRTRRNYKGRLVNDYFIEDHLGNTRMVLTDERDTVAYLANFETNRDGIENAVWRNRNNTRETIASNNAFFNNPNPNAQYSRLNGSDANRRKGPGLVLKVMAGDTLNISTRALYNATSVPNTMATVNEMVTAVLTGFLGAASGNPVVDNKAWLPTNNGIVLNSNALNGFVTNNQNNNSHTGAPRAYLKYLLFDEDFKLVQGFAERIDNGANTVHTYTTGGQLVVPKNGFIYVFTTNESPVDVWFDDVSVIHRTGPLLQESSFYPFGMEITPLSSYAAIKVPNERDYQKNELDEEFGLELHYFDARMYDAQVGRFGGVDPKADKQFGLTPYHQSANNPVMFVDPDGRIFFLAAALLIGAKIGKVSLGLKMAVGAAANIMANRSKIAEATKGKGNFWKGLGTALGYGAVGAIGATAGTGFESFLLGGSLNVMFEGATGQFDKEGINVGGRMLGSFLTGGFSALAGKNFGMSAENGVNNAADQIGRFKLPNQVSPGDFFDAESPLVIAKANQKLAAMKKAKNIFSWKSIGKYSLNAADNVGSQLNKNNGHMNLRQFGVYAASGFISGLASNSVNKLGNSQLRSLIGYGATSYVTPFLSTGVADFTSNLFNYYGYYNEWPKKLNAMYSDGFKSLFKIDFYTSSSFWGFNTAGRAYRRAGL